MRIVRLVMTGLVLLSAQGWIPSVSAEQSPAPSVYRVQQDQRMCPYPLCGGVLVRQVNRATTPCPNGMEMEACYSPRIDFQALGLSSEQFSTFEQALYGGHALVSGTLTVVEDAQYGSMTQLQVTQGWVAATDATPSETLYTARDNGIRCFAAPCFSYDAATVNTEDRATVSDVNLTPVVATEEQRNAASTALTGPGLLVAGTIRPVPNAGPAGEGRELSATQFYLPVNHARP